MASASPHNRAVQCTHESLLGDQNIICVPPRAATEAPPNNTSSARAARVGGDQCQCEQRANTDGNGGAGPTMASAAPHNRAIPCTQESLLDDQNVMCVPPRAATEALLNNTGSARAARVGGDQCGRHCKQSKHLRSWTNHSSLSSHPVFPGERSGPSHHGSGS